VQSKYRVSISYLRWNTRNPALAEKTPQATFGGDWVLTKGSGTVAATVPLPCHLGAAMRLAPRPRALSLNP